MRITLLGHDDLASLTALNRIVCAAPEHAYSIFLSGAQAASKETPHALQTLAAIDRSLSKRFLEDGQTSPILKQTKDLPAPNGTEGLAVLRAGDPDLIVSIRYRRILKESAIAIPRRGVINLHSGILPDYRGVMATFWAMLNGEGEIGTTLHRIVDSGIDTGPIIKISRQPMRPGATYLANVLRLYGPGCDAMLAAIEAISRGEEPAVTAQIAGTGHYFSTPEAADLARFHAEGRVLTRGDELGAVIC